MCPHLGQLPRNTVKKALLNLWSYIKESFYNSSKVVPPYLFPIQNLARRPRNISSQSFIFIQCNRYRTNLFLTYLVGWFSFLKLTMNLPRRRCIRLIFVLISTIFLKYFFAEHRTLFSSKTTKRETVHPVHQKHKSLWKKVSKQTGCRLVAAGRLKFASLPFINITVLKCRHSADNQLAFMGAFGPGPAFKSSTQEQLQLKKRRHHRTPHFSSRRRAQLPPDNSFCWAEKEFYLFTYSQLCCL